MPFGLSNAQSTCINFMTEVQAFLEFLNSFAVVYFDDNFIHSSKEEHLKHMPLVVEVLQREQQLHIISF